MLCSLNTSAQRNKEKGHMTTVTAPSDIRRFDASNRGRETSAPRSRTARRSNYRTVGVRFMAWAEQTGGGSSLVEHPIAPAHPRRPGSQALEGGRVLVRPRGPDGRPARGRHRLRPCRRLRVQAARPVAHVLERRRRALPGSSRCTAQGGFEHYFDEFAENHLTADSSPEMIGPTAAKYGLEFDFEKVPLL